MKKSSLTIAVLFVLLSGCGGGGGGGSAASLGANGATGLAVSGNEGNTVTAIPTSSPFQSPVVGQSTGQLELTLQFSAGRTRSSTASLPASASTVVIHLLDAATGQEAVGSPVTVSHTSGQIAQLSEQFTVQTGHYSLFIEALDENSSVLALAGQAVSVVSGQATSVNVNTTLTLENIYVTPLSPSILVGQNLQMTAWGEFSDRSWLNLTSQVNWTCGNSAASINASGLLNGLVGNISPPAFAQVTASLQSLEDVTDVYILLPVQPAPPTPIATPTPPELACITYGNGLFVACGNNYNLTSPDGLTWTRQYVLNPKLAPKAAAFGGDSFVVTGNEMLYSSADGIQWTALSNMPTPLSPLGSDFSGVTFGDGQFALVARGTSSTPSVWTSPDAATWTVQTVPAAPLFPLGVHWTGGLFVVSGEFGGLMTSRDGVTWASRNLSATNLNLYDVAYGDGTYVASCQGGDFATSTQGVNWTVVPVPNLQAAATIGIVFGNGQFVGVGSAVTSVGVVSAVQTSADGIGWTSQSAATATDVLVDVIYANGLFVAVGSNTILTSPDGVNWTRRTWTPPTLPAAGTS